MPAISKSISKIMNTFKSISNSFYRWFDQWGLVSESEKHQREQAKSISDPDNVKCEMAPFESKKAGEDTEIVQREYAYVVDINKSVKLHLEANERQVF